MNRTHDRQGQPLFDDKRAEALRQRFFEAASVMARLRRECPWDIKQTHQSLKKYLLEEAHEVLEAIDENDHQALCDELGDLLLQVLFHAEIQRELGHFDVVDVLTQLADKLVRRHPHIFASEDASDADAVARNWDAIKKAEKGGQTSLFDHWTKGLPALLESYKIGKKAAKWGFDWPNPLPVLDKIEEEIDEIREAVTAGDADAVSEELGDMLFAMSQLVRKFEREPEDVLRQANRKFMRRFRAMETLAKQRGLDFASLNLDEQDALWQAVKAKQRQGPDSID